MSSPTGFSQPSLHLPSHPRPSAATTQPPPHPSPSPFTPPPPNTQTKRDEDFVSVGFGLSSFRMVAMGTGFKQLDVVDTLERFQHASRRALLLDWGGTLTPVDAGLYDERDTADGQVQSPPHPCTPTPASFSSLFLCLPHPPPSSLPPLTQMHPYPSSHPRLATTTRPLWSLPPPHTLLCTPSPPLAARLFPNGCFAS